MAVLRRSHRNFYASPLPPPMEFTSRGHNQASFRVFLGLKWVSIRKSEGITVHERFSIAYTKWLYLPYVVCRRKGAATAAARLSFLSPSLHGYPNFTPESQYLLITLEGIVLYSLLPLSLSLYPSPSQPISLFPTLSPSLCLTFSLARPPHVLLRPTFSPFFSLPPLSRSTLFFEKKRNTGWFSLPSRCQDARSCSSRYFLYSRSEGRERRNAMKIHPTTLLFLETSASRGRSGMPRRLHRNSKKSEGVNSICASARLAPNKSNPCATSTIRIRHETFKSIRFGTVDEPLGRYTSEHLPLDWRFRSIIDPKLGYFRIADNLFRRHCFRKLTEEQHLYNIRTIL